MILALDVHYKSSYAKNVGVLFNWADDTPIKIITTKLDEVAEYVPGLFYKRELPCLLDVIAQVDLSQIEAIIVDGHVFIDNAKNYGLGGYLWDALSGETPIIGVAKRAFHQNELTNEPVLRGESKNPLYVSAIGMDIEEAVQKVKAMHGVYRMPTILQIMDTETKTEFDLGNKE
jgi:deoxyribonuclease V